MNNWSRGGRAGGAILGLWVLASAAVFGEPERIAFFVSGDPQYLADKAENVYGLDPLSEEANQRFIKLLNRLPGSEIEPGVHVATNLVGLIVTGDLIDSLDKNGGYYPAMQRFEWNRFKADYGLTGKDGKIPFPVYELHGNHDGPQGDSFVVDEIVERNRTRPHVVHVSTNGLHYSWNWGPLHGINLGMFVGAGDRKKEGHHYAARDSLAFLIEDLKMQVGDSGRPVMISHHLHLTAGDYDWPDEDRAAYYEAIKKYNVVAIFNGHTHGSPPRRFRWNGEKVDPRIEGIDVFDPDDSAAAKMHKGQPVGLLHGLLYVELIDAPGVLKDRFRVRSYLTRDNWKTARWDQNWVKSVAVPGEDAYTVALGGRLYDKWYAVTDAPIPGDKHRSYPEDAAYAKMGASTWRCKECHGWDYKGKEGAYASGKHVTGIVGVLSASKKSVSELTAVLSDPAHGFDQVMSKDDLHALTQFLKEGLVDMDKVIDRATKKVKGDAGKGKAYYQTICAGCHGLAGKAIEDMPPMGKVANENPWESFHKIMNGQPGTSMPALRALGNQVSLDILRYTQSLPKD